MCPGLSRPQHLNNHRCQVKPSKDLRVIYRQHGGPKPYTPNVGDFIPELLVLQIYLLRSVKGLLNQVGKISGFNQQFSKRYLYPEALILLLLRLLDYYDNDDNDDYYYCYSYCTLSIIPTSIAISLIPFGNYCYHPTTAMSSSISIRRLGSQRLLGQAQARCWYSSRAEVTT